MTSSTKGIRAGRAFVELFADDSKLVRGLKSAQRKLASYGSTLKHIGTRMLAAGMGLATPLLAAAKAYASMGSEMFEMSKRTGVSVEALSQLAYAADQSGVDMESLEKALRKMQSNMYKAAASGKVTTDELQALGLTVADIKNLSPEDTFKLIADRISKIDNPTKRAAVALELFGRAGTGMLPMFEKGAAGIEELMQRANDLGITMSGQDAEGAHALEKSWRDLLKVLKMAAFTIGSALGPALKGIIDWIVKATVNVTDWIKQNKGLVTTIATVAAAAIAGGAAFLVAGYAMKGLAAGLGGLAGIMPVVKTLLTSIGAVIAALCNPIGMTILVITALGATFLYATGTMGKAIDWIMEGFQILADETKQTFGAIGKALASGDIALAAKVLWLFLKLEWERGCMLLEKAWLGFKGFFIRVGAAAFYGVLKIGNDVWAWIADGWENLCADMSELWTLFTSSLMEAWNWCAAGLEKAWNKIKGAFDDSFNADEANKAAEARYQEGIKELEKKRDAELAAREQERQQNTAQIEADRKMTDDFLNKEEADVNKGLDDEWNKKMAQSQADIDKAKAEWQAAVEQANNAQPIKHRELGKMPKPDDIGDLATAVNTSVRGTFNVNALLGLAGGTTATRIAKATERTADAVEDLSDEFHRHDMDPEFS